MLYVVVQLQCCRLLLSLQKISILAVFSIYFDSVDSFLNRSCNFVRFIKYIKNKFISNFPRSCCTLQNNIRVFGLWSLNVIYEKTCSSKQLCKSAAKFRETLF